MLQIYTHTFWRVFLPFWVRLLWDELNAFPQIPIRPSFCQILLVKTPVLFARDVYNLDKYRIRQSQHRHLHLYIYLFSRKHILLSTYKMIYILEANSWHITHDVSHKLMRIKSARKLRIWFHSRYNNFLELKKEVKTKRKLINIPISIENEMDLIKMLTGLLISLSICLRCKSRADLTFWLSLFSSLSLESLIVLFYRLNKT